MLQDVLKNKLQTWGVLNRSPSGLYTFVSCEDKGVRSINV
jgi:hypothetical protein